MKSDLTFQKHLCIHYKGRGEHYHELKNINVCKGIGEGALLHLLSTKRILQL
jgi:hypothetical protein